MKRADLIRSLRRDAAKAGKRFELVREGRGHEVWQLGETRVAIPRHREIAEGTARAIRGAIAEEIEGG